MTPRAPAPGSVPGAVAKRAKRGRVLLRCMWFPPVEFVSERLPLLVVRKILRPRRRRRTENLVEFGQKQGEPRAIPEITGRWNARALPLLLHARARSISVSSPRAITHMRATRLSGLRML